MVVILGKNFEHADLQIPRGEYWVSARSDSQAINLSGGGKDYPIPAHKRKSKRAFKTTSVQFHTLDGKTWSLVLRIPPNDEWAALLQEASVQERKRY